MAIHDADLERRNLTITSVAFIAYYYEDGKFVDQRISLQLINADVAYENVLAWLALVWFVYRFYLSRKKEFGQQCNREILELKSR